MPTTSPSTAAPSGRWGSRMSHAVIIRRGDHNTIGSDVALTPARLNVMSGYVVGVALIGEARHNAIVGNRIGGEPDPFTDRDQKVGVLLRRQASNNLITNRP